MGINHSYYYKYVRYFGMFTDLKVNFEITLLRKLNMI